MSSTAIPAAGNGKGLTLNCLADRDSILPHQMNPIAGGCSIERTPSEGDWFVVRQPSTAASDELSPLRIIRAATVADHAWWVAEGDGDLLYLDEHEAHPEWSMTHHDHVLAVDDAASLGWVELMFQMYPSEHGNDIPLDDCGRVGYRVGRLWQQVRTSMMTGGGA